MDKIYHIIDRCQQKVFKKLPNPVPVSSVALQIDKLDLILTQLEIKLLDCIFKLDRRFEYIMFNQGSAATWFGVTRRKVNEALAHLKELGFITFKQWKYDRCCIYKLSSFFKLEDVQQKLSRVFKFFRYLSYMTLSEIFSIDSLEKVTLITKELLYKTKVVTTVHMLTKSQKVNFMNRDDKVDENYRTSKILDGYTATQRNFQKREMQKPYGYQQAPFKSRMRTSPVNGAMYEPVQPMQITEEEKKRIPTVRELFAGLATMLGKSSKSSLDAHGKDKEMHDEKKSKFIDPRDNE